MKAVTFMDTVRSHPKFQEAEEILFVGHSLGGTIASLLAILNNASAVVFNAPGWYFASSWLCEQLRYMADADTDEVQQVQEQTLQRMCNMDPAVQYPVFNIFLEEDLLPHTFDYGLGYACPIPYELIREAATTEKFSTSICKVTHSQLCIQQQLMFMRWQVKLFNLLNVNFPSGWRARASFRYLSQVCHRRP